MNQRKLTLIENLIIIMFPISLFIGCTSNGEEKNGDLVSTSDIEEHTTESAQLPIDLNTLTFVDQVEPKSEILKQTSEPDKVQVSLGSTTNSSIGESAQIEESPINNEVTPELEKTVIIDTPDKFIFGFASNAYNVSESDLPFLKQHAEFLLANPTMTLTISGHADKTGPVEYNKKLSDKRARHVMQILVTYGAPADQLMIDSYGESQPENDINELALNRRVELQYAEQTTHNVMLSANK